MYTNETKFVILENAEEKKDKLNLSLLRVPKSPKET